jgi:hypothetical protein
MWFRITIRRDGSIASCAEVESALANDETVIYVDAENKTDALYLAKREWHRNYQRARSLAGICRCGKPTDKDRMRCRPCLDKDTKKSLEKYHAKRGGTYKPLMPVTRSKKAKPLSYTRVGVRQRILTEVLRAYDNRAGRGFREYLLDEIRQCDHVIQTRVNSALLRGVKRAVIVNGTNKHD